MTTATVGALRVVLGLDSASFTEGLTAAQKHLRGVGRQMESVGATIATVGAGLTATISTAVAAAGFHLLQGSQDAAAAAAQVNAALASMGGASGKTAGELSDTAEALRDLTGIDDDEILKSVTANLLTFGNVAGATFDRAQRAILDLSARLGGDLQSATMLVGKALNDPIRGLAALRRTGIQFTEQQQDQIKAMAAVGDMAGAQAVMLAELERQFGGAAEAAGKADVWTPLKTGLMELEGTFEPIVRNVLAPMIARVGELMRSFAAMSPAVQTFVVSGAAIAAALGPALIAVGAVTTALGSLTAAFATGGVLAGVAGFAVAAAPFIAAAGAMAAAVWVFRDDLAPIFAEFQKAATAALGPPIQSILAAAKEAFAALGPAIKAMADLVGPLIAALGEILLTAFGPIVLRALQVLAAGIGNAFSIIGAALRVLTAVLKGDWSGAWNAAGSLVMTVVRGIGNVIEAIFPGIGRVVGRMVEEVKGWLGRKLAEVFDGVIRKVKAVGDAFFQMYDAVVGHSYVPDMVEGVAEWMAKLDAGMVVPAARATDAVKTAFESLRDDVANIMDSLLTDTERAARELARATDVINRAVADPRQGVSRRLGDQVIAGLAGQGLSVGSPIRLDPLGSEGQDIAASLREGVEAAQSAFNDAAREFGDAFAYNMERALRGDIKGAFLDMIAEGLNAQLRDLGASLFKSFGKDGGLGGWLGGLFKGLPGFATGGSFKVGGSGGIDSKLVAFRATPGEMVDIRRPGQGMENGGGALAVHVSPSPYFDVAVERVATPVANRAAGQAINASRKAMPALQQQHRRLRTT